MLRIGGELASVQLLFSREYAACAWLTAMDSRFEQFSPSRLLFAEINREEVARFGTRLIDHMPGYTAFKEEMMNQRYACKDYELVNTSRSSSRVRYALLRMLRLVRHRASYAGHRLRTAFKTAPDAGQVLTDE